MFNSPCTFDWCDFSPNFNQLTLFFYLKNSRTLSSTVTYLKYTSYLYSNTFKLWNTTEETLFIFPRIWQRPRTSWVYWVYLVHVSMAMGADGKKCVLLIFDTLFVTCFQMYVPEASAIVRNGIYGPHLLSHDEFQAFYLHRHPILSRDLLVNSVYNKINPYWT